jgi:hypothetical protein
MDPKPTLHHYLWSCNVNQANGECHNIAAGFVLACRIVGVKGPMNVGYLYPQPGRLDVPPEYPHRTDDIQGMFNRRFVRSRDNSPLCFIDGNDFANNFEGAVEYNTRYYAIGEGIFKTESSFYALGSDPATRQGAMDLAFEEDFYRTIRGMTTMPAPYPSGYFYRSLSDPENPDAADKESAAAFKWETER